MALAGVAQAAVAVEGSAEVAAEQDRRARGGDHVVHGERVRMRVRARPA